jgi:hypothetical protein
LSPAFGIAGAAFGDAKEHLIITTGISAAMLVISIFTWRDYRQKAYRESNLAAGRTASGRHVLGRGPGLELDSEQETLTEVEAEAPCCIGRRVVIKSGYEAWPDGWNRAR